MFKFGNGQSSRSVGVGNTELRIGGLWISFFDHVFSPLGPTNLGAIVDFGENRPTLTKVGTVARLDRHDQGVHVVDCGDVNGVRKDKSTPSLEVANVCNPGGPAPCGALRGNKNGPRHVGGAAFLDISFNGDGASPAVGEEVTLAAATLPNHQESSGLPIEEHVQRIVESTVYRLSGQMWKQGANPPGLPAGIWRVIDEVCG